MSSVDIVQSAASSCSSSSSAVSPLITNQILPPTPSSIPPHSPPLAVNTSYQNKRDIKKAREAYNHNDVEACRAAHNCYMNGNRNANTYRNDNVSEQNVAYNNNSQQNKSGSGEYYNANNKDNTRDNDVYSKMEEGESDNHNEAHNMTSGEYLKAFIFGGLDGIVTIFAIVAGCVGANLSALNIITIGVGNLFADAVSMAFGEYVSAKAEDDFVHAEKKREEWEVENCPEEEKSEMIEIYTNRYGFSKHDAQQMVDISFKYRVFFIQHMMVEELGLMTNGDGPTPIRRGLVMFVSFSVFGLVPLACFIGWAAFFGITPSTSIPPHSPHASPSPSSSSGSDSSVFSSSSIVGGSPDDVSTNHMAFFIACVFSLLTLFILGVFKGRFVGQSSLLSGLLMALNGSLAGTVAYVVGALLQKTVF